MVDYPTPEDIKELNKQVLRTIMVRKADTHRVIRRGAIEHAIKAAMDDPGVYMIKLPRFLSCSCKAIHLMAGTGGQRSLLP